MRCGRSCGLRCQSNTLVRLGSTLVANTFSDIIHEDEWERSQVKLRDELRDYAYNLGIDYLRVADAHPFFEEEALLRHLAASNKYPSLAPQDISVRCHPDRILENARSIISVAISYLLPEKTTAEDDGLYGTTARFARVADYHTVVSERLALLVAFLQARVGRPIRYRICVDNGPLLERVATGEPVWGGLENNMLYVPKLGSGLFWERSSRIWLSQPTIQSLIRIVENAVAVRKPALRELSLARIRLTLSAVFRLLLRCPDPPFAPQSNGLPRLGL